MQHRNFPFVFTDQLQNQIFLPQPPQRIISLVPSQTELLFDLGLSEKIVGITKFCIHPHAAVKTKTKVGGTKNFDFATIRQLKPDLIIGNKEENYPDGIIALQKEYPVWVSDIVDLPGALTMMKGLGELTSSAGKAAELVQAISNNFAALPVYAPIPTAYFIWRKPFMGVGQNTFIEQMMQVAGFTNVFSDLTRYPVISPPDLENAKPALILLSSEPYPFKEKHIREMQEICPTAVIKLVDGELFSWYGSRLIKSPAYFKTLRQDLAIDFGL